MSRASVVVLALAPALVGSCERPSAPVLAEVELDGYRPARADVLRNAGWATDFGRAEVPVSSLRVGRTTRDAFRPIDEPRFARAADVALRASEPVLVFRESGVVRAWPLAHLVRRELALDGVGEVPVAVTFCSLCASARVFDRRLGDRVVDLGVSGLLLGGNALLYDRETESLWRQVDGRAVAGELVGRRLRALPTFTVSFGALRAAHPDAPVMLEPDGPDHPRLLRVTAEDVARGDPPSWLTAACASPLELVLATTGATGDALVLRDPATAASHRARDGGPGPPVGSSAAFRRDVDGRALSFDPVPGGAVDRETRSRWNLLGEAVEGPLRGSWLEPLPQTLTFRFARTSLDG